jgi:uncharacterized repeat protein (TIGR01451 family)
MARTLITTLIVAAAAGTPAIAAQGPLQVASKIFVEQRALDKAGAVSTSLAPATRAVPGDHIVFVLAYRNTGAQPLSDIVLDNPVPGAITYRAPGAGSATPELSVDGKTYGALAQLRVPTASGGSRAATSNDVRHIRWRIATVPAGGQGQLAFKAVLK